MNVDIVAKHVLFVDDEAMMPRLVGQTLRSDGLRLTFVADGAQALRALEQGRVDLLVTSLTMPVLDGIELLRHVANRGLRLPVIVVTDREPPPPPPRSPLRYLREPLHAAPLVALIREQLAAPTAVEAISVAELAQLLALERRSCTLRIGLDGVQGELQFTAGALVDGTVAGLSGDSAARMLLAWRGATLRIESPGRARKPTIVTSLAALIPGAATFVVDAAHAIAGARATGAAIWVAAGPADDRRASATNIPAPMTHRPSSTNAPAPATHRPSATNIPVAVDRRPPTDMPTPADHEPSSANGPTFTPMDPPAPPRRPALRIVPPASPEPDPPPPDLPPWERPAGRASITALLAAALAIEGTLGAALAFWELDDCIGVTTDAHALSEQSMRTELSGNCRVMRAMTSTLSRLGQRPAISDVLITLDTQTHVLSPVPRHDGMFLDLVLDKARGNLALTRMQVRALLERFDLEPAPTA